MFHVEESGAQLSSLFSLLSNLYERSEFFLPILHFLFSIFYERSEFFPECQVGLNLLTSSPHGTQLLP